jgi:putative sigma-54 modulation protein
MNNKDGIANKTVELKIFVPGNTLFSQADAPTFEAATDEATEGLKRQIKKHKEKLTSH